MKTTTVGGAPGDTVEVIHDADRCYGYVRHWGREWKAWRGDAGAQRLARKPRERCSMRSELSGAPPAERVAEAMPRH
jgi:hypothetical protein